MSGIIDAAYKQSYHKVRFTSMDRTLVSPYWTYDEYTDWTTDLSGTSTDGFKTTPTMEVKSMPNNGLIEDQEMRILLPEDTFTLRVAGSEPITRIKMDIWERFQDPEGASDATDLHIFSGYVVSTTLHPLGKRGVVRIAAKSPKNLLDVKLGMMATPECLWTLGEGKCGAVAAPMSGFNVGSVAGKLLIVNSIGVYSDYYFHRGYILRNELRIGIREWRSSAPTEFHMTDVPPQDWVGAGVFVMPGCDKTLATCRSRWSSESTFMGFGYGIPAYQPSKRGL